MGLKAPFSELLSSWFKDADANGDGYLSKSEFAAGLARVRQDVKQLEGGEVI